MPPLTDIVCPVIYDEPGENRYFTRDATSSGFPCRLIGTTRLMTSSSTSADISVSIMPGATEFTVILRLPFQHNDL